MPTATYDCIIVGTGPAGLGAAFHLHAQRPDLRVLIIDKAPRSSGGLRNDCKMNFTYPVGFPADCGAPGSPTRVTGVPAEKCGRLATGSEARHGEIAEESGNSPCREDTHGRHCHLPASGDFEIGAIF